MTANPLADARGSRHVVVVGAGPAGLSAARAAAEAGARVTVLDASHVTGGQYWRHPAVATDRLEAADLELQHGWTTFRALDAAVDEHPGIEVLTDAQVWAAERHDDGPRLHVLVGPPDDIDRSPLTLRPDALVLATGAHDRTLPFPGWQLPGVTTAGAAQALAKSDRVAVGRRVVVAGAGPFLLPVAATLARVGATVLGVHEASGARALARGWLPRPWLLAGSPGKLAELTGYAAGHVRHRIPYRTGEAVIAAHGADRVEAVTIARLDDSWAPVAGTERIVEADAVFVSHGFTPRLELAIALGTDITAARFVAVDADQRTSTPGVWAAGESTGIAGVDAALAEGWIAGHHAAGGRRDDTRLRRAVARRRATHEVSRRMEAAHGIRPGWVRWLEDDTLVCRCEEVSVGRLREAASLTCSSDPVSVKLTSRAGLGICQGRMCSPAVSALLGAPAALEARPIVTPVRLGDLARARHSGSRAPAAGSASHNPH
ncbi:FAD/NAD(P)-binding oxidoreductase [Terrabacter terrae]|uniref:FAD/NAD(P)-binding oxidoreductase n=1 Tax=Terrabacter terrae TaxID=318434 RepID=A0ABN2U9P6_9MICO